MMYDMVTIYQSTLRQISEDLNLKHFVPFLNSVPKAPYFLVCVHFQTQVQL